MEDDATSPKKKHTCLRLAAALICVAALCTIIALELLAGRELRRANALAVSTRDRSPITYYIDDGRMHPFTAPDDTNALRVVVIGDSITRGANCFFSDSFGARLERLLNLNAGTRPARVDVYAEAGTGTIEQRRLLNQAFRDGRIDLVILAYCMNDTEDFSNAAEFTEWRKAYAPLEPGRAMTALTNFSRFAEWRFRRANARHMLAGTDSYYRNLYSPSYSGVKRMEIGMRYFRDSCRSAGTALTVVVMPLLEAPDAQSLVLARGLVTHMTAKLGIPTLDLWNDFKDKTPLRMTTIPGEDGHLSEIAHRVAAEAIFEFLLANGLVDDAYTPANMNTTQKKFGITRLAPRRLVSPAPDTAQPAAENREGTE